MMRQSSCALRCALRKASSQKTFWTTATWPVTPSVAPEARPSFHTFDEREEWVGMCRQMAAASASPVVHTHSEGHVVPADARVVDALATFVRARVGEGAA